MVASTVFCEYCPSYCCYRLSGSYLFVDALDINRIARHFGITDGAVRKKYIEGKNTFKIRADGSCIFLINGKISKRCGIHLARPRQCQDFPYNEPCPYITCRDLLETIEPRIIKSVHVESYEETLPTLWER